MQNNGAMILTLTLLTPLLTPVAAGGAELRMVRPFAERPESLRAALEAHGARVTHVLPDGRMVVLQEEGRALPAGVVEADGAPVDPESLPVAEDLHGEDALHADALDASASKEGAESTAAASTTAALVGDVAVGLVLPESTGEAEPSRLDWSAAEVDKAVELVVQGTIGFALAPGAPRLTFRIELLSAPPAGGAAGTVACRYEALGRPLFDPLVDGSWLGALGFPGDAMSARRALAADLRARTGADAAFLVKVVHDGGAPGRAAAILGGPQVVVFLGSTATTVLHETAHAFGALDEYCPGACYSPTELSGSFLGANANSRGNDGTGYFGGRGEGAACAMMGLSTRLCAHTRRQLGWGDLDRDGRDDLDQLPARTTITRADAGAEATVVAGRAELQALLGAQPVRAGRVVAVEVRVARGAWVEAVADDGAFDSADEAFTALLPALPDGEFAVEARAVTASGRV